ncbi:MAG TPA: hypothetical protein VFQ79_09175 [Bryobacteraceae bacterium]|nr:hypothetical protein [Bryobacteraceae bacterium]
MNTQREKVQFTPGETVILALEFDPPADPRPGRFGDQYMYWFAGDKVAWLDPPVHAQIVATGARAGDEIAITRAEVRNGARKRVEWQVQRVEDEPADAYTRQLPPEHRPTPPTAPAQPAAEPRQVAPPRPTAELASALIAAIDAAGVAERYAREQGLAIRFTGEDIRALANAIFTRPERSL